MLSLTIYFLRYLPFFEVFDWSEKCPLWDASTQENICPAFVWSGKCPSGMRLVGEVSVGEVSGRGSVRRGYVWLGKCPSGMCQVGELSVGEVSVGEESVGEMSVGDVSGNLDIQAFNLKSLLCGSKRNKRIKLNTNKAIIFSHTITYQGKSDLKKFFGGNRYIS